MSEREAGIDWPEWCYTNKTTNSLLKDSSEVTVRGRGFGFLGGRRRRGGRGGSEGALRGDSTMTEKTEGGGQDRQEGGAGRREAAPPPRSYSEFMRSLAAKYNNENPAESTRPEQTDPRAAQASKPMSFPPGVPIGFPPFLLPPSSMPEGMKDAGPPVSSPFHFLPGFRPPPGAPGFPPGLLPPGLLDPSHAQALLTMMRGQIPNHPSFNRQATHPPLDLAAGESPAKKDKERLILNRRAPRFAAPFPT